MKQAQIYCTLRELIEDMKLRGDENSLLDRIRAASTTIEREIGAFIPVLEERTFSGRGQKVLVIDPVLSVDQLLDDGIENTTFTLLPQSPRWIHGPSNMIRALGRWSNGNVEITGSWGKYNELGFVLDSLSLAIDDAEIVMANGSLLDVGRVLLTEDEQISVTSGNGSKDSPPATLATSLLDGAVAETDEVVGVDDGSEFNTGEVLLIGNEDLLITRIIGNDLTVERGWNNSLIDAHSDDDPISVYRTFSVERAVNGTTAAAHTNKPVERYLIPADVNWLCRQIAGLMYMKAKSGFQGRTGNAETGESMYFSEFPPNQMERIKSHYSMKVY